MKKLIFICFLLTGLSAAKAQTGKDAALHSIGSLSAFSLYDAYCVVGLMADAYSDEVYEAAYVNQIMDEQITLLTTLLESMNGLSSSGFLTDEADKTYIISVNECANLLISEANALKTYISSPVTENSDAFQNIRAKTWTKISALLGIE